MRVWTGRSVRGVPARRTWRVTTSESRTIARDSTNGATTARARASVAQRTSADRGGTAASAARHARREALQAGMLEDALVRRDERLTGAPGGEPRRERGTHHRV